VRRWVRLAIAHGMNFVAFMPDNLVHLVYCDTSDPLGFVLSFLPLKEAKVSPRISHFNSQYWFG